MEIINAGVQAQEFLSALPPPKALLLPLLTSCGTVGLFNDIVAARRGDHLLVIDGSQARNSPDRGSIAPQLIGTDRVWDIIFAE